MARKTPDHLREAINRHVEYLDYITDILRVKATVPVENQAPHVREKPVEYWTGLADGANAMLENCLLLYGCYAGFGNIAPKQIVEGRVYHRFVQHNDPEYAGWRRLYYTRG